MKNRTVDTSKLSLSLSRLMSMKFAVLKSFKSMKLMLGFDTRPDAASISS